MLNPQAVAQRWKNGMNNATDKIKDGVNGVTESPMAKAAANVDGYVQGVQRAAQSGKWAAGLNRVSLSDWKSQMVGKGIANMSNGVNSAVPKVTRFLTDFLPYADSVKQQIAAMPNVTENDAEQRAIAAIRLMRQFKRSG